MSARRVAAILAMTLALGGAARAATVVVELDGIDPIAGTLYVALCEGGVSEANCRIGQDAPVQAPGQRFVFEDVAPGSYAVAAFQDLNGNGRLDRTGLGLPLEPYGFSGESLRAARPEFERARFGLREPGLRLRLRLARALPPR